jgi:two-component system, cell cycle sensor histidine kinase and response regulator CckA
MINGSDFLSKFHGQTLLVVDDEAVNLTVISDYFKTSGVKLIVARDGDTAVERALSGRPDLILLDVMMPGMDGFETCEEIKSHPELHNIPVIFMTGLADLEAKIKGFKAGAVDFISKPIQYEEMLARISVHLQLRELTERLEQKVQERTEELQKLNESLEERIQERTLELRRSHAALQESEERFRETAYRTGTIIYEYIVASNKIKWGGAVWQVMGYTDVEMEHANLDEWLQMIHPDDRSDVMKALEEAVLKVGSYNIQYRLRRKDNIFVTIEATGQFVNDEHGKAWRLLGFMHDVTERKKAEEELKTRTRELEEFNRAMVDREVRIIEMKEEVNRLCNELGKELKYPPVWKTS